MKIRELAARGVPVRIQELRTEINEREAEITKLEAIGAGLSTMRRRRRTKLHWTQTPEGRRHFAQRRKKLAGLKAADK